MKNIHIIFFCIFSFSGFAQDTISTTTRAYVNIKNLRENNIELTPANSLSFKIIGNDTLVPVENTAFSKDKASEKSFLYEFKDDNFLEIYKDVVFKNDSTARIKIWKDGVKLYFEPGVPKHHQLELKRFAARISIGIDSLKITEVKNKHAANYIVVYRESEAAHDPEPRINNKNNSGYYVHWNGRQELYKAILKINTFMAENENYQFQLLKFHFFKSLGYFFSSPKLPCESFLSHCNEFRRLTGLDLDILKYHYSYGIYKKMNRKEFENFHKNNKEILAKDPTAVIRLIHEK